MKSNVDRDVWFPIFNLGLLVKLMYVNISKFTSIPWPYAKYVGNAGVFSRIYNPRPAFFGKFPACTCSWHRLESTKSIRSKRENGKIGCDAARFSRFCEVVWIVLNFQFSNRKKRKCCGSVFWMLCSFVQTKFECMSVLISKFVVSAVQIIPQHTSSPY